MTPHGVVRAPGTSIESVFYIPDDVNVVTQGEIEGAPLATVEVSSLAQPILVKAMELVMQEANVAAVTVSLKTDTKGQKRGVVYQNKKSCGSGFLTRPITPDLIVVSD
jgi:hypothetical protein